MSVIVVYTASWREILSTVDAKSKKWEQKKTQKPVETAAAVEIGSGGLRHLLIDDFHRCCGKASATTLRLFHSYHRHCSDHLSRVEIRKSKTRLPDLRRRST